MDRWFQAAEYISYVYETSSYDFDSSDFLQMVLVTVYFIVHIIEKQIRINIRKMGRGAWREKSRIERGGEKWYTKHKHISTYRPKMNSEESRAISTENKADLKSFCISVYNSLWNINPITYTRQLLWLILFEYSWNMYVLLKVYFSSPGFLFQWWWPIIKRRSKSLDRWLKFGHKLPCFNYINHFSASESTEKVFIPRTV